MDTTQTLYYVFSGRFPSEKAHALYVANVVDSFSDLGFTCVVVASNRGGLNGKAEQFFNTKHPIDTVYMPTVNLASFGLPKKLVFFVNYFCFTFGVFFFFLLKKKKNAIIFSNESVPSLLLSLSGKKVVYEMHDYAENYHWFFALLYKKVCFILSQNQYKKEKLISEFNVAPSKIIVEPNGVDLDQFTIALSKGEARKQLALPQDTFLVVYTGHLFDWKGADILANGARLLPSDTLVYFVGGSPADVERFSKTYAAHTNIFCVGHKPHKEMPLWQKAADCLVLPNTATQTISKYYTSPMKLFEYMASGTPIVASDIPSIRAVVDDSMVTFFESDNAEKLAAQITKIKTSKDLYRVKTEIAQRKVIDHTWEKRARRLCSLFVG